MKESPEVSTKLILIILSTIFFISCGSDTAQPTKEKENKFKDMQAERDAIDFLFTLSGTLTFSSANYFISGQGLKSTENYLRLLNNFQDEVDDLIRDNKGLNIKSTPEYKEVIEIISVERAKAEEIYNELKP